MRSGYLLAIVTLLVAIPARAAAAEPLPWSGLLTLAQAVERAEIANFDVRLAQADADAAASRTAGARANLLPQIGISETTSNGGITQLGMPYAQQTYFSVLATLPIFEPSAIQAASAATRSAQAADYLTAARRSDAMLLAAQGYERALLAQAVVEARTVSTTYQQRHVDDVAARVRTGDSARYQLLESQAALARAQQALEDATADRDAAISDLEVVLDFEITPDLRLADALSPLKLSGDATGFIRRALTQRPDILAARSQLDAADRRLASARAQYLPTIAATAQTYNGRSNPPLGSTGYQVGVSASLPVLDSGARPAAVHEAHADVQRARIGLEQSELSAQRDVVNAWRVYQAAQRNLKTAHAQSASAAEELRIAALRDQAGKGTTLELLSAFSDDAGARESELAAIARFNDAIAAVHHAAGDTTL